MHDHQRILGFLVHDVARLLRKRFEQNARGSGLTRSQWQVLAYLDRNEGIHQGGLAELLEIEPITLGRIVDKLQAMGLVERLPHASDRRIWLLRLTAKAKPKLAELKVLGDRTRSEALSGIAEADRERLLKLLTTLKSNLASACATPPVQERASNG
ncbi:MarR family transcriptional regulator [Bradyrhizobium sp. LHD-71]|uniref:MarR family winged helix-turn-helix transcriptional regulator n=1 Tax=Bradyrhizobium sp. LHD-71 TaxID=3072141 RepID=UPI00280EFBED|nr:MarR family transcriptional regulator [Bradyrhizobium sp. LHD-71]MDQ8731742.1 MarR family transcriptional regulator [Bradyrhizobium sp. LHD-71]